jgi:prophage antirepressor-like protein
MKINAKYSKGQTINYKSGEHFQACGEVIDIQEKVIGNKSEIIYLVSEGNGGQRMTYVSEADVYTLLNG